MELVKKNLLSIIFGVVAILAIVADFYPMGGKREALKAEAAAHARKAEDLRGLLTKQRSLPIVKPGGTEAEPLNGFPTKQAVEVAHQATEQVNKAADALAIKASDEINKHKPLVEGALPGTPGDTLPQSRFARYYIGMFPPPSQQASVGGAPVAPPAARPADAPPSLMDILHAGVPPTNDEFAAARVEKQKQVETEVTRLGPNGPINPQEVMDAVNAAFKTLNEEMRSATAKKSKVYVAPDAFSLYPNMTVASVPEPTHIFWAQIGLWVQEDICKAIADMNEGSANVIEAPVKRLVKITFVNDNTIGQTAQPGPVPVFVSPGWTPTQGVGTDSSMSMAMTTDASGAQTPAPPMDLNVDLTKNKNVALSPTGRQSNGLFDVVHFEVELEIDAAKVPQVLDSLGSKRYISVIQLESLDSVDSALMRGMGYYFGPKPCVKIKVKCEELFFRSWLQNFVPTRVKTQLGYPAPQAATPPA